MKENITQNRSSFYSYTATENRINLSNGQLESMTAMNLNRNHLFNYLGDTIGDDWTEQRQAFIFKQNEPLFFSSFDLLA